MEHQIISQLSTTQEKRRDLFIKFFVLQTTHPVECNDAKG